MKVSLARFFFWAALLPLFAGCASVPVEPQTAREAIAERSAPPPPLRAVGKVRLLGPAGELQGKGTLLLALQGERFRLQVIDPVGRTLAAVARRGASFVSLDPATGARTMRDADDFGRIDIDQFALPTGMIPTLLTGAPPLFGAVLTASRSGKKVTVKTKEPVLTIVYAKKIVSVTTGSGEKLLIKKWRDLERRPYVAAVTLSKEGEFGSASVIWESIEKVKRYPPGFFQFRAIDD